MDDGFMVESRLDLDYAMDLLYISDKLPL